VPSTSTAIENSDALSIAFNSLVVLSLFHVDFCSKVMSLAMQYKYPVSDLVTHSNSKEHSPHFTAATVFKTNHLMSFASFSIFYADR
jgi:hypothetical protein